MGVILSKFRRAKPSLEDSLEKIDKEMTEIRRFQIDTAVQQKRIIGQLSIVAIFLYALGILVYYLFYNTDSLTWLQTALSLLPFIVFPIIIWSLRKMFSWWYQRKIVMNEEKVKSLRKDRERLLDEVMEKETFKVAKKILEKYAPSHLLPKYLADQQRAGLPATPLTRGSPGMSGVGADGLRRRTMGAPGMSSSSMRPLNPGQGMPRYPGPGGFATPGPFRPRAIMGPPGTPGQMGPRPAMSSMPTGFTPMRYMLPQAPSAPTLHNRKAGWMDKLVDYVVGDGPTQRFALICRYCATHNGLATPDDFPYTGYRCIYCRQFNPPKQQRPSAHVLPKNTVLIEEMDTTVRDNSVVSERAEDSEAESGESPQRNTERQSDSDGDHASEENVSGSGQIEESSIADDGQNKENDRMVDEDIPFADDDGLNTEDSIPGSGLAERRESNSIPDEEISIVGKFSVDVRGGDTATSNLDDGGDNFKDFGSIGRSSTNPDKGTVNNQENGED